METLDKEFPNISLYSIVPYSNQSCKWNDKQISRCNSILKQCDKVVTLQDAYTFDCMQRRNRYMVEHSDCVVAVWNGTSSGTSSTVNMRLKINYLLRFCIRIHILSEIFNLFFVNAQQLFIRSNGLLREFYPKGRNLSRVSTATPKKNPALINARPKKVLLFRTPQDLFQEHLSRRCS